MLQNNCILQEWPCVNLAAGRGIWFLGEKEHLAGKYNMYVNYAIDLHVYIDNVVRNCVYILTVLKL